MWLDRLQEAFNLLSGFTVLGGVLSWIGAGIVRIVVRRPIDLGQATTYGAGWGGIVGLVAAAWLLTS
jgi:hypothetical protein